jgi:hypothetical protein
VLPRASFFDWEEALLRIAPDRHASHVHGSLRMPPVEAPRYPPFRDVPAEAARRGLASSSPERRLQIPLDWFARTGLGLYAGYPTHAPLGQRSPPLICDIPARSALVTRLPIG